MRHKKDLYFVCAPSSVVWTCVAGGRLRVIPPDNQWRIIALYGGPDYGQIIWQGEV
jgi:hypothetical protein